MPLSKKQLGVVAAGVAVVALIGVGAVALVSDAADASAETPESQVPSAPAWVEGAEVPEAIAALRASGFEPVEPGKLTVAHSAYLPPLSYLAEGEEAPVGTEPNIAKLVADGLGLEYAPVVVAWADWPLGVQSGKYDLVISNVTVTEERKELFDFATYRTDLLGFSVKSDSSIASIASADDIEGLRIIVGSGTNQEQILLRWNEELVAQGRAPAELQYFDDTAAATLAVQSGRADAQFGPNATYAWQANATGETKVVGTVSGGWPETAEIGAATAKDNGLVEPVQLVLQAAIANGTYQQVLDGWGLDSEGVASSEVNPAGLPKP